MTRDDYHFPATIFAENPHSLFEFVEKAKEELAEVEGELYGGKPEDFLMECFDVVQVMESVIRKVCAHREIDMAKIREAVYQKNLVRNYYPLRAPATAMFDGKLRKVE